MTGENFKSLNRGNSEVKQLKEKLQEAKEIFKIDLKQNDYIYTEKTLKLERQIEMAEYNLYCAEYEDNRRRNWN